MEDRPISKSVERLNALRHEHIPGEVGQALDAVRSQMESLRADLDRARVPGLTARLDEIAVDMLNQIRRVGDAASAATSTEASKLTALLRPVIQISSTSRTYWPLMRNPPEDRILVVDNDATYKTGQYGRIISVHAILSEKPPGKRNDRAQKNLRGKVDGDDAGHLIARELGGIGYELNLVAMEGTEVNRKKYRRVERTWKRAVEANKTVEITVHAVYMDDGFRPAYFEIEYVIDGKLKSLTIKNTPKEPTE